MQFTDAVPIAGTRRTTDGYLVADAKAVRTGIQMYAGAEVGRPDLAQVRVYRSEAEVRSADSLRSFSHAPVTIGHPAEPVTADNWKTLAVGEVSTAATWDGNRIALPLILKDAAAVLAAESGLRELSAGYTCDLDWTPGTTVDGQAYDAQQKNIRANHLAMVPRGRAGPECRIGDAGTPAWGVAPLSPTPQSIRDAVPMKMYTVDGHSVELNDAAAIAVASLRDKLAISVADNTRLSGEVGTLTADHAKAIEAKDAAHAETVKAKDKELATKDAEIEKLKANQIDDAKLDVLAAARADVIGKAKAIVADVKTDGVAIPAIRRAVVVAKLGDAAVKDKSDDYVEARFDMFADAAAKSDPLARAIGDSLPNPPANPHGGNVVQIGDAATEYARMRERDANAWKKEA